MKAISVNICKKCKAACCKLGGADFTKKEKQRVLDAGYKDFFVRLNDNHYELTSKNGRCPYLKQNNTCKIYEVRPLVCTTFPVYVNIDKKNNSKYEIIDCPLAKTLTQKEIKEKKKQVDMVKKIICTTFSSSKLPKKDLELIEKRFNRIKNNT